MFGVSMLVGRNQCREMQARVIPLIKFSPGFLPGATTARLFTIGDAETRGGERLSYTATPPHSVDAAAFAPVSGFGLSYMANLQ